MHSFSHVFSTDLYLLKNNINIFRKLVETVGYLYVGQSDQFYGKLKSVKGLKHLDNKIVECKYEPGGWVFMRERTDKSFPNSFNTAEGLYLKKSVLIM